MPTPWSQVYMPLGSLLPSALIAALPVVVLLGLLGLWHVRAHLAALAGLAAAMAVAIAVFGMPLPLALAAAGDGALYGLFPIGWIVLNAIFVYAITVETGSFDIVRHSVVGIAEDRRIQVLLVAFCFGAFVEGAAGFGTPVAISAAMLIGLGFKPLPAAGLSLIGNTAPVAFGALGTPIIALAGVTHLPLNDLSAMVGKQLPLFAMIIPFWLIWVMAGWRSVKEVWPACLVAGVSFGAMQYFISNHFGPTLVDIGASLTSIVSLLVLLRFWQPRTVWRFPGESSALPSALTPSAVPQHTPRQVLRAWMPWGILSVLLFTWGFPSVKAWLNAQSIMTFTVPYLHQAVLRTPPVVAVAKAEDAIFTLNWLSASGTALLLTGLLSGALLGMNVSAIARTYWQTLLKVRVSLVTIAAMMALGFVTRYGGLDATMGLAFAQTGMLFAFFSPLLGWLGVALTGSDTSSNVLFGNLQQISANQVGVSPLLAAAANSSGGVMGKMIDAQSIVVAGVATGQQGQEGEILRYVFWHSLALACLVGIEVLVMSRM
ncbi:MAG: lactate permease LctP family transporter [Gemmatimonadaceae bacterium]|nr:lactate permease LctP family transporter [Gemmatimonadaceae bacterium]